MSPRTRAAAGVSIHYVAFDELADSAHDHRHDSFHHRRARLEQNLAIATPPLRLTPSTTNRDAALDGCNPGSTPWASRVASPSSPRPAAPLAVQGVGGCRW